MYFQNSLYKGLFDKCIGTFVMLMVFDLLVREVTGKESDDEDNEDT